jgi:transcriptional regulator with XRE-family HTH domain
VSRLRESKKLKFAGDYLYADPAPPKKPTGSNAPGLTFQQIQKYEKCGDRMSAAIIARITAALKVDVQYFFEDLPKDEKVQALVRES